jgi:RNA polymerase sigma-70 factor (ECF subfamily)
VDAEQEVKAFLARLDPARREALAGGEARLVELLGAALEAWPGFRVAPGAFLAWLVERLPAPERGAPGVEGSRGADLYLAFACSRGDTAALRRFEQHYLPEMEVSLVRLRLPPSQREELLQQLQYKLLVARGGLEPRIGTYEGRGDLRRWVRAVATREGLEVLRKHVPEVEVEEAFFEAFPAVSEDMELRHVRREYQEEFKRAFEEALASLAPEERNLLRWHFIDGLTTPRLAALHGMHRVTMFRRLRQVCETLADRTRGLLLERLPLSAGELESLNRLIRSQLDLSLERLLPSATEE